VRKSITKFSETSALPNVQWLDLATLARAEVTSEDAMFPIELAFAGAVADSGWRAAVPGQQGIRLFFDHPQRLRHIHLIFLEPRVARTQEFVLRWSPDGNAYHEIVRQRWNFSPQGATEEREVYHVNLSGVAVLELTIIPDINGGDSRATLARLNVA
jgi:hypothetical protein